MHTGAVLGPLLGVPSFRVACDMDEFPPKVEATDFQGGNFADPQAAHGSDQQHEFEGVHGGIDDSCGGIRVEEKNLWLRFLVSREHDITLLD